MPEAETKDPLIELDTSGASVDVEIKDDKPAITEVKRRLIKFINLGKGLISLNRLDKKTLLNIASQV